MKPPVPGAGRAPDRRRRQVLALAAGAFPGLGWGAPTAAISPGPSHVGARLLQRVNGAGMPEPRADAFGPMTLFVFPTAVAATSMDLYIADPGLGALLRYDPALDAMALIAGARVTAQSRLAALGDGSVLVANGGAMPVRRYARSGRILQGLEPPPGTGTYDEVVADALGGRFLGLDRVQGRLEEILPHGRGATVLPPGLLPDLPVALAADNRRLYVAGRACACVEAIDLFAGREKSVIAEDLDGVTALAAGDGWLAVADGGSRQLRLYREGMLRADPGFAELHLVNPQGLAIASQMLYVADPGSRRIATFRLRP